MRALLWICLLSAGSALAAPEWSVGAGINYTTPNDNLGDLSGITATTPKSNTDAALALWTKWRLGEGWKLRTGLYFQQKTVEFSYEFSFITYSKENFRSRITYLSLPLNFERHMSGQVWFVGGPIIDYALSESCDSDGDSFSCDDGLKRWGVNLAAGFVWYFHPDFLAEVMVLPGVSDVYKDVTIYTFQGMVGYRF